MKISWDDDILNWMEKNMFQTTNQDLVRYYMEFYFTALDTLESSSAGRDIPWSKSKIACFCIQIWNPKSNSVAYQLLYHHSPRKKKKRSGINHNKSTISQETHATIPYYFVYSLYYISVKMWLRKWTDPTLNQAIGF